MVLPAYPTWHGEKPGYPGAIPAAGLNGFGPPQRQLTEGSVEHYRAYMFKYLPIRSMFDRQSQVRRWIAPQLPGATANRASSFAAPLWIVPRFNPPTRTQYTEPAVEVLHLQRGDTIFDADLGRLPRGMYCLRVIAAVPTEQFQPYRRDLFVRCTVNDRAADQVSVYRNRIGYIDQFYSIIEFYFHAAEPRAYHAKLAIEDASQVDLLVREVSLDDALTGIEVRPIKQRSNEPATPEQLALYTNYLQGIQADSGQRAARLARDQAIWDGLALLNRQWTFFLRPGSQGGLSARARPGQSGQTVEQIEQQHGKWVDPLTMKSWIEKHNNDDLRVFLRNNQLNLEYTAADFAAGKPLPAPFPFPDDGLGLSQPDADNPETGWFYCPLGIALDSRSRLYQNVGLRGSEWLAAGEAKYQPALHDALVALARFVYDYPGLDCANELGAVIHWNGPWGRQYRTQRRETVGFFISWYTLYPDLTENYDRLFDVIKDNQFLADSLGRFIPWIKSPGDVIAFFDSYLVQHTAKKIMRYHYHTGPVDLARVAAVLGDAQFTDPWMQWQFARTFVYPLPPASIGDLLVTGHERGGPEFVGSTFYATGENASRVASGLEGYLKANGNPRYSLVDDRRYPKVLAATRWPTLVHYAGTQHLRVGDVTGPDKAVGSLLPNTVDLYDRGWRWTGEPPYAAALRVLAKPSSYHPEQWRAIEQAAAAVRRLPWLDQPSRYVANWAGVLEGGRQHDDYRFRRGAFLRTGRGIGHAHDDSLDLQIAAHGLPLVVDLGQRPGYTKPASGYACVHNVVTYGDENNQRPAWVRTLSDLPGAPYLLAQAYAPEWYGRLTQRQLALIDVDEGEGSQPLPLTQQLPGRGLPPVARTASSYVIDINRGRANGVHRYNFHAMVDDQFEWNATSQTPAKPADIMFGKFTAAPDTAYRANAPATLVATWRQLRTADGSAPAGSEQRMLGKDFDPQSPRKFLRLHLTDTQGLAVERAAAATTQANIESQMTCISVIKPASREGSVFAAVVEPYAGEPFIEQVDRLPILHNEADAQQAVALAIDTRFGQHDLVLADGRPEQTRQVPRARSRFAGEYAFVSRDEQGLRTAQLAGGTLLDTPSVRLTLPQREYRGEIAAVDYPGRSFTLDADWPALGGPQTLEIGSSQRMVTYTTRSIAAGEQPARTTIVVTEGAQRYVGRVEAIDQEKRIVEADQPVVPSPSNGENHNWTVTNAAQDRFWKASAGSLGQMAITSAEAIDAAAFAPQNQLLLWEYGPGDTVRLACWVGLQRQADGTLVVLGNSDAVVELPAHAGRWTVDGETWQPLPRAAAGWVTLNFTAAQLNAGQVRVQLTP